MSWTPGYKAAVWNAANVASGVYVYRIVMTSGQTLFVDVRKMLLVNWEFSCFNLTV